MEPAAARLRSRQAGGGGVVSRARARARRSRRSTGERTLDRRRRRHRRRQRRGRPSPASWAAPAAKVTPTTTRLLLESALLRAGARAAHGQAARPAHRGVASLRARHRSERRCAVRRRAAGAADRELALAASRVRARSPTSIRGRSRRAARRCAPRARRASLGIALDRDRAGAPSRYASASTVDEGGRDACVHDADVPARSDARDRSHRGDRAAARLRQGAGDAAALCTRRPVRCAAPSECATTRRAMRCAASGSTKSSPTASSRRSSWRRSIPDGESTPLRVANPLREEQSVMRTSLLPGLCLALQRNLARGNADVRIFEVGAVFLAARRCASCPTSAGTSRASCRPRRRLAQAGRAARFLRCQRRGRGAAGRARPHGLDYSRTAANASWLHPGMQAALSSAVRRVGCVGELHPERARELERRGAQPLVFEIDLAALAAPARRWRRASCRASRR